MTGGLTVKFKQKVTNEENDLAAMLLYVAKSTPDVVTNKQPITCSGLTFPGKVAARFCKVDKHADKVTIPPKDFIRIVEKLMEAELVCTIKFKNGNTETATAAYLPIALVPDENDPYVFFTGEPQCYFEEEMQNSKMVRQLKPRDEMLNFMRECIRKELK